MAITKTHTSLNRHYHSIFNQQFTTNQYNLQLQFTGTNVHTNNSLHLIHGYYMNLQFTATIYDYNLQLLFTDTATANLYTHIFTHFLTVTFRYICTTRIFKHCSCAIYKQISALVCYCTFICMYVPAVGGTMCCSQKLVVGDECSSALMCPALIGIIESNACHPWPVTWNKWLEVTRRLGFHLL
jgi:hypothetical protein